eukprot:CAMPEP_0198129386 /NCGR_PEP_ID=MMETSP1442-20131203/51619_1 /TAXON_ID= /ORGANISM="Craspedostauros australis, Strain CCMP3328" /LENGTH=47 /DNA_ID= /DNA_START= /DNA_END= /DNA_ORIENTATION=
MTTHRGAMLRIDPSRLVYSLPMLPKYSSPSFTADHSHFIPLSDDVPS